MDQVTRIPDPPEGEVYIGLSPGFVNYRLCNEILGPFYKSAWAARKMYEESPIDGQYNNLILCELILWFCKDRNVKALSEVLLDPKPGEFFSSLLRLKGRKLSRGRRESRVILPFECEYEVFVNYSDEHFVASTLSTEIGIAGYPIVVVGQIRNVADRKVTLYPVVMGWESFSMWANDRSTVPKAIRSLLHSDCYQTLAEDIDEFAKCSQVTTVSTAEWQGFMRETPEAQIKEKICTLLGVSPQADWGGEECDIYSDLHVEGRRKSAAWLLKGPGSNRFRPMRPVDLGKQGDQIYRMSKTTAELLVVQHCHDITSAVVATLKSFALCPPLPRRYSVIDGRTTYRILKAYNLI